MLEKIIRFFLENKVVTFTLLVLVIGWGVATAPFAWKTDLLPRDPVPVDAIPDIGENQQIVFTRWMGRSPQDVEDQITYPLTTSLLGIPGVKTIRSNSMFGFSSIYVIFEDNIEFYWSRSRILEKLSSLPPNTLPEGTQPQLGPDATALGQVFWYTLEGRDKDGKPAGGWDLHELRSVQDYYVKYALNSVQGVSEVASVGGYVKEYQIDVDPSAMKTYGITLKDVVEAVRKSNIDIGAKTLEVNKVEYFVRGLGYVKNVADIEESVVKTRDNTPLRIRDIARVAIGPATRRGALDKTGAEVVGGVVVARYGSNPLAVIDKVKEKIREIEAGLPEKVLDDGRVSKLRIVPFYDRSQLIHETLGTLEEALSLEILITILVVIVMVINMRASLLISSLLPVAVLMVFIAMKYTNVDANIVALSGIAIAIGTMVDMGIILTENVLKHMDEAAPGEALIAVIGRAATEVGSAIVTAVATTIVSFLPVFSLQAAEGKLFTPLAFTKTYALFASVVVALIFLPAVAHVLYSIRAKVKGDRVRWRMPEGMAWYRAGLLALAGIVLIAFGYTWAGVTLLLLGIGNAVRHYYRDTDAAWLQYIAPAVAVLSVSWLLAVEWMPLGPAHSLAVNLLFILVIAGAVLGAFMLIIRYYTPMLRWCLDHRGIFLGTVGSLVLWGILAWVGVGGILGGAADGLAGIGLDIRATRPWQNLESLFPGTGKEFMPALDEGAFLLMPTSMPHAGMEQNLDVVRQLDMSVAGIPEVEQVVGKLGRVESALDPAPISMYENVILYKPEYVVDENGNRLRFKVDGEGRYIRDEKGELIPDPDGQFYRNWREHIHSANDIWNEIVKRSNIPGMTSAPKLQPIQTRLVMLQTGMRAPMGIKVYGPDLPTIEQFGLKLEQLLQNVPGVKSSAVFADRIVGKPYLEVEWNRAQLGRYGITIAEAQQYLEVAVGGMTMSTTVEGRERYAMRVRYPRELRGDPEELKNILLPGAMGVQIPLGEVAAIKYERGPQSIKSENTFLVGYVIFDRDEDQAEVNVVQNAQKYLRGKIDAGELVVPAGVSYTFAGNYENQLRAEKRLSIVIPISLVVIFLILYLQFRSVPTTLFIFSAIAVSFSGGFILIWFYGQEWFMNFPVFGESIRALFQMHPVNLSVAVWVGFIALFGIATDDGVVMATYLDQSFRRNRPKSIEGIRKAVLEGGQRRIRPCLMTTATTLLALLPVLTSTGRGSDIMVPMAIPAFGGMTIELLTLFVVPVLYSWWEERKVRHDIVAEEAAV
ncbi:MAG: efflux RND transporter permease subunit [Bacteroidetes bacterium]|nr:efflux RND transporter permease subunit [Bacteroidota bacterium]